MMKMMKTIFSLALFLTILNPVTSKAQITESQTTSANMEATTMMSVPINTSIPILNATQKCGYTVELSWSVIDGAVAYAIYKGSTPLLLEETTENLYLDLAQMAGSINTYTVAAIFEVAGEQVTGNPSTAVDITIVNEKDVKSPYLTHALYTGSAIKLNWISDWKADSYTIFRRPRKLNSYIYTELATVSDTDTYLDESIEANSAYEYQIRANKTSGESLIVLGDVLSAWSFSGAELPIWTLKETSTAGHFTFTLNAQNSTYIKAYSSNTEFGSYTMMSVSRIKEGTNYPASVNVNWGSGTFYKFRVEYLVGDVYYMSDYSDPIYVKSNLTIPDISFRTGGSKVRVSWGYQERTQTYDVYYSDDGDNYTLVSTDLRSMFEKTGLIMGQTAYFKIRPVYNDNYGPFTEMQTVVLPPTQYLSATYLNKTSIAFSWTDVFNTAYDKPTLFNNDGFLLYRTINGVDFSLVAEYGKDVSSTVLTINPSIYGAYRLVAFSDVDGIRYTSEALDPIYPIIPAPKVTIGIPSLTTFNLGWGAVAGADGYLVKRRVSDKQAEFEIIADTKALIFTDTNVNVSDYYYYQIYAYYQVGDTKVLSEIDPNLYYNLTPLPVQNLNVFTKSNTTVGLTWDAIPNATGYEIYRREINAYFNSFSLIATVKTNSYTNTVSFNVGYEYDIVGYTVINGVKYHTNYYCIGSVLNNLAEPVITVTQIDKSTYKLSWLAVPLATGYYVLSYWGNSVTKVYTTSGLSYTIYNMSNGARYMYGVIAYYKTTADNTGNSLAINNVSFTVGLPIPANFKATADYDTVSFSYSPVTSASGYEIYASLDDFETKTLIYKGSSTNPILENMDTGSKYKFQVRAMANYDDTVGTFSKSISITPSLEKPVVSSTILDSSHFRLSWKAIPGADSYTIYLKNQITGFYEPQFVTEELFYEASDRVIGVPYDFKVRANHNQSNGQQISDYTTLTVTLTPLAPTNLAFSLIDISSIKLSFTPVADVTGYEIYRSTTLNGTYTKITTITSAEYVNTGLSFNATYFYKVRSYVTKGGVTTLGSYSSSTSVKTALQIPQNPSVVSKSYNSLQFSWKAVNGASGYEVYRATGSGTFALIGTTTSLNHTSSALVTEQQYQFKVRAYRIVNLVKVYGAFTEAKSGWPTPTAPVLTATVLGYDSIRLTWPTIPNSAGYAILKSDSADGPWNFYSWASTNSLTVSALTPNKTVYFVVQSYVLRSVTKLFSPDSNMVSATPLPLAPILTAASSGFDSISLNWNAINGATGYELYIYDTDSSSYVLLSDQTLTSYVDSHLISGVSRTYKVKAYRIVDGVNVYSLDSTSVTSSAIPSLVTGFFTSKIDVFSINLSWNTVNGAIGYEISRSATLTGVYNVISTVEENLAYTDSSLAFNTSYFYKIRAYTLVNDVKVYGNSTTSMSAKTALQVVINPSVTYTSYNTNAISWTAVNGATGYEIYRSIGTSSSYALLTTLTKTSYSNTSLLTNTKYNYKIRAYRLVGTIKVYGAFSSIVSAIPLPWAPTATVLSSGYNSLKVTWPAISGAHGYEVSYSTSETGTYIKLALTTLTNLTIPSLLTNTKYFVKVRAYRIVSYTKVYGASSSIVSGTPIPSTPVVTAISAGFGSIKLSWLAISGATGYEVYAQSPESPDYFLADDVTLLTSTVVRLMTGSTYNFKVKAYRIVSGSRIYSTESAIKSCIPVPSLVTGFKVAMPSVTSLKISWIAVDGATGYEVLKSSTLTGTYLSLGTVEGITEFIVSGLTFNTTTYYKVRAYTTIDSTKIYSSLTTGLAGKTMPSTASLTITNNYTTNSLSWSTIDGATGYEIYTSSGTSTYYTLLKTLTTTTFIHSSILFNTQYNYKVRAYKLVGSVKYYGSYSTLTSIKTAVNAPSATVTSTHDSIGLSWSAITGASGYEVSISSSLTGPYSVTTQTNLTKTFSGLTTNSVYYLKLRSYRLISTTKVYGPYSSVITVTPKLEVPSLQMSELTSTSASFSWTLIPGASDYEICLLSDAVGSEWIIENVSELSVTFSDLDPASHYSVKIRSLKKIEEISTYSEYSEVTIFSYSDTN